MVRAAAAVFLVVAVRLLFAVSDTSTVFPLDRAGERWVDQTRKRLTLDEKVGQLIVPSVESNFLSSEMAPAQAATNTVNEAAGANGNVYKALQDAANQQQSMAQLYQGFVSDIQNVDMGQAISNLNLNQTALQAALQVTAQLNKVSLLNFL